MDTVNDYRARYSRSSDEDLLAIAAIDAERLTPEAQQALAEEVARRGLRPGGTLAGTPYLAIPPSAPPGIVGYRRYAKAHFGRRLLAYLIDGAISVGGFIVAGIVFASGNFGNRNTGVAFAVVVASFLWALYYSFTKDGREAGQSFGKEMLNLMVVNVETNQPCSVGESALRALILFVVNLVPVVGWLIEPIFVLASDDGRRLGDRAANTQVIDASAYVPSVR